ncbi:tetratricopeptide repeat protein [Luteibacter yeojuensis]|uniref:tetratricopeptide repeat protein n=1 Tax=Luteibacter yeojuensis TaxID=345309 RepID=UPI0018DD620E|nr:tetratricopeptide repeat protein [Luteibacter yeojuensis]
MSTFDGQAFAAAMARSSEHGHAYVAGLASQHDAAAQTVLGQMLLDGIGCAAQPSEAIYWFMQAAHAGSSMAMNMLGRCHENGWGTRIDHDLATVWFRKAAHAGLDWGMYNYAHSLEQGRGVPLDRRGAFEWFGKAAGLGHARAQCFLARFYEHGWETARDWPRARDLFRASAEAGDYRGECAWASVLAAEGDLDGARLFLERGLAKAPPMFIETMRETLVASDDGRIRALAATCG